MKIFRLIKNVVGKPDGKRPLGKLKRRWEDNIKRDLWEVGLGEAGTEMVWFKLRTGGVHLLTR